MNGTNVPQIHQRRGYIQLGLDHSDRAFENTVKITLVLYQRKHSLAILDQSPVWEFRCPKSKLALVQGRC